MTVVLLIRHAHTDWINHRLAGWTPGIHLSDEGRRQVDALVGRLASVTIDAIYASPLERAMETARPLAADRNLAIETRIGLGETMTGEWIGRSVEELKQTDEWKSFLAHPGRVRIPGGETAAEVQARMVAEIESIRQAHPKGIVAVVSHADPIKITVAHYLGLDLDYLNRLVVSPASVTMLRLGDHGARLLRLNDTGTIPTVSGEALR